MCAVPVVAIEPAEATPPTAPTTVPVATAPATLPALELTPPGMSHEATSGTKRMTYAPTSMPIAYIQFEPMP